MGDYILFVENDNRKAVCSVKANGPEEARKMVMDANSLPEAAVSMAIHVSGLNC